MEQTAAKRGSADALRDYKEIIKSVSESESMQKFWNKYRQDFSYAADITFETVCDKIIKIMDKIKF
ncbi:MAG: hypothetical protein PUD92_07175 [Clostridiales bacterium]|nr:hypothetical protein [Clostridiales bacterium]